MMTLYQRSARSILWNVFSSQFTALILFVRSVILARLLPVEVFGVYSLAGAIVYLSILLPAFGLGDAFLHRSPDSEGEEPAAAVHFTLKLIFLIAWGMLLILLSIIFASGSLRNALINLTLAIGGFELTHTARLIFIRRVDHRRLAGFQVLNAILTTLLAIGMAVSRADLWALLITDYVTLGLAWVIFFWWQPVWKPRFDLNPQTVRYFLNFGSRVMLTNILQSMLDKLDDLWTGFFLGNTQLGYYSRAYTFATYPRRLVANPIEDVSRGAFSEISQDRQKLEGAFQQTAGLLVRSGFFFGGWLSIVAPEIILILLGDKWLPMLAAFRLMLIYTLLDPLKGSLAYLFIACGQPEKVTRVRLLQLAVFAGGLFGLGSVWGIGGVALAVDLMLLVGISAFFYLARRLITLSLKDLFLAPTVSLILAILAGVGMAELIPSVNSVGGSFLLKSLVFGLIYGIGLFLLERKTIAKWGNDFIKLMDPRIPARTSNNLSGDER